MHRLPPSVRRFLDLEAGVDDDEERNHDDEEEEEEEEALRSAPFFFTACIQKLIDYITDNFIDDHSRPSRDQPVRPHRTWNSLLNHDDDDEIFGDLLKRAQERSRTRLPAIASLIENEERDAIRARPSADDYPLWRVKCRVGF